MLISRPLTLRIQVRLFLAILPCFVSVDRLIFMRWSGFLTVVLFLRTFVLIVWLAQLTKGEGGKGGSELPLSLGGPRFWEKFASLPSLKT